LNDDFFIFGVCLGRFNFFSPNFFKKKILVLAVVNFCHNCKNKFVKFRNKTNNSYLKMNEKYIKKPQILEEKYTISKKSLLLRHFVFEFSSAF
jgi:hypothetical protein